MWALEYLARRRRRWQRCGGGGGKWEAKVAVKRVSCFAFSVGVCCIVFAVRQGWRLRQQDTTKQDKTIRSFGIHGIKYNNEFTQMQIKMQMIRIGFRK